MSKNPILNAIASLGYISLVASIMNFVSKMDQHPDKTILGPIAFLSLLSLSVTMMGYLFLYNPLQLYLEGKKKEAANLFLKTAAVFAVITVILLTVVFSGLIK